jgi:hypothetical protein
MLRLGRGMISAFFCPLHERQRPRMQSIFSRLQNSLRPARHTSPLPRRFPTPAHLILESLETRIAPATDVFINPAGGNWGDNANWSLGHPPMSDDDAVISALSAGSSVILGPGTSTINDLSLDSTLTIAGQLIVPSVHGSGTIILDQGTLSGATVGTGITITVADSGIFPAYLDNVTIDGTLVVAASTANTAVGLFISQSLSQVSTLTLNGTAILGNGSFGGLLQSDGTLTLNGTGSVILAGTGMQTQLGNDPNCGLSGDVVSIGPDITVIGQPSCDPILGAVLEDEGTITMNKDSNFGCGRISIGPTGQLSLLENATASASSLENAGMFTMGPASSILPLPGDQSYTQDPTGSLTMQFDGSPPANQAPRLSMAALYTAPVTLAGTFQAEYVNGFVPSQGESFWIIGSTSMPRGTFDTVIGGTAVYQGNGVFLNVAAHPPFVVTTLADSGPGSLRSVIAAVNSDPLANGADQITFASTISGGTISLLSPLPALMRDQVSILGPIGLTGGNAVDGDGLELFGNQDSIQSLTLSFFSNGAGVFIAGNDDTVSASQSTNNLDGIDVSGATGTTVGGTTSGAGNVIISNAQYGINLDAANNTTIEGNWIGTDSTGQSVLGNASDAIEIQNGASNNAIGGMTSGAGNTIAFNGGNGVTVLSGTGNGIHQNLIYGNGGLPIELGNSGLVPNAPGGPHAGPNDLQSYPIITNSDGIIQGYLNSTPNTTFTIEVYAMWQEIDSATGMVVAQSAQVLGQPQLVTTDASGNGTLQPFIDPFQPPSFPNPNEDVLNVTYTGTATDPSDNTSECGLALTPAQITKAYSVNNLPMDADGNFLNGAGQTIAIVVAYNDPKIITDLAAFDQQFGLTAPVSSFLKLYNQAGTDITGMVGASGQNGVPIADVTGGWEVEESLDVEWAHAIAPGADIDVVEADSASVSDFLKTAVPQAASLPNVSVVSMSIVFQEGRFGDLSTIDHTVFVTPPNHVPITFVAATGDNGALYNSATGRGGPAYPSASPNVVAVGGTTLVLNSDGSYGAEQGWSGSGGDTSAFESEPAYQLAVQLSGQRSLPDVAFIGGTLVAVADSFTPGNTGWMTVGGTSLSAPCWAGLFAIVNQGRAAAKEKLLNSSSPAEALTALYALPTSDFHNNLGGNNGSTFLSSGRYDEITGLGTPIASLLVPNLIDMTFLPTPILQGVPTNLVRLGAFDAGSGGPYSASVNWDDGTTDTSGETNSPLRILIAGSHVVVFGRHTFPIGGLFTIAVTLTDSAESSFTQYAVAQVAFNVTSLFTASQSPVNYDPSTTLFDGSITVTNTGSANFSGSSDILLQGLPVSVRLVDASITIAGQLYALPIARDSAGDLYVHIPQSLVNLGTV